jgi:putative membrane protein
MFKHFTKSQLAILAINAITVLGFGSYYIRELNYEFIAYALSIVVVIGVLYSTLHITKFPTYLLAGVTVWGVLHMMGGSVQTADGVLYAYKIYPFFDGGGDFYVLKMDQFVHAYLYGVVGLMFFHLLRNVVGVKTHQVFIAAVAIFAAAGFSIINEIVEFWAAMNIPGNGVGGYENTVLDLIFNLGGSFVAVS